MSTSASTMWLSPADADGDAWGGCKSRAGMRRTARGSNWRAFGLVPGPAGALDATEAGVRTGGPRSTGNETFSYAEVYSDTSVEADAVETDVSGR